MDILNFTQLDRKSLQNMNLVDLQKLAAEGQKLASCMTAQSAEFWSVLADIDAAIAAKRG